jgi:hypothetical protein
MVDPGAVGDHAVADRGRQLLDRAEDGFLAASDLDPVHGCCLENCLWEPPQHANFMLASSAPSFMTPWQRRKIVHSLSSALNSPSDHQKLRRGISLSDRQRPERA